jgi:hypothetical protein
MNDDIQLPSVHGLNLTVPEDAKALIKSWDEREDTSKYADSNVDDQASAHCQTLSELEREKPHKQH